MANWPDSGSLPAPHLPVGQQPFLGQERVPSSNERREKVTTSEKKLTRRSFLTTTALAAGAMATAGMAGCASVSTDEKPELSETGEMAAEEQTFVSTCRGNCGGGCALQARVREGKIVSTHPMTFPNEYEGVEQGCVKGMATPLRLYGAHRLRYPMKLVGERGSGQWEQISWDEAIDLLAGKLKAAMEEYGPASVCIQGGAGNKAAWLNSGPLQIDNNNTNRSMGIGASRFMRKTGCTVLATGDDMSGLYFRNYLLQIPMNALEDLPNAKTIVVWGSNPAEASFARSSWYWICKAKEAGAKVVTIDPLYTPTAAHSDEWLPIKVGTDAALMCAMANYIIDHGLADADCLARKSNAPFLIDADGKYLRLSDTGAALEEVEDAEGEIAEEDQPVVWDEAAQAFVSYTKAESPAVSGSFDANGKSVRTVYDAVVENIRPFTVEFAANECGLPTDQIERLAELVATNTPTTFHIDWGIEHTYTSWRIYFGSAFLAALTGSVGVSGGAYSTSRSLGATIFDAPKALDMSCFEVEGELPSKCITGDYLVDIMETGKWAGEDFPVRALVVQAADPLDNFSGPTDLMKAYEKIDFICTIELFMTTTAHYSDLVLPAALPWEAEDFSSSGFMCQKAIDPIGEARGDFEIFVDLARAMGYEDLFDKTGEEYLRGMLDTPENLEAGLGYDIYHEQGAVLKDYEIETFATPESNKLGVTRFYLEEMQPRDDWGQTFPMSDRMPNYEHNIESYAENPDRERYPLYGFSSHDNYHGQSVWAHNAWLDDFRLVDGKPFCRLSEKAAAERGIQTGDKVRVFNDHGSCVLSALVTKGIQEDSVWVPHGFFWDEFEEGFAQTLTGYYPDPVSSNSNFNDWICEVEKIEGGAR